MLRATRALSISPFLVVFTLVVPSGALAQGLSVSPNCGTPFTHFIVGGGGWPYPPGVCPDSCTTGLAVMLDSDLNPFYSAPECMASFVVDLQGFPGLLFNQPQRDSYASVLLFLRMSRRTSDQPVALAVRVL